MAGEILPRGAGEVEGDGGFASDKPEGAGDEATLGEVEFAAEKVIVQSPSHGE